jgi:hypothetical protein
MDLEIFLRFITRIRVFSGLGLVAAIALGVMVLNGVFDPTLSVVLGIVAGVLLVAGIGGLIYAQKLTNDVEASFHREHFETSMAIMMSAHQKKTHEAGGQDN